MQAATPKKLLVSPSEAAEMLGMSRSLFYQLLSAGRIPLRAIKFGRKRLYDVEHLRAFVRSGCSPQWRSEDG